MLGPTKLIAPILGKLELERKVYFATPVYSSRLDRPEGAGRLAVGDAASSYDPIVARGIKALEDGVAAGHLIAERSDSTGSYSERIAARFRSYAETRAHLYESNAALGLSGRSAGNVPGRCWCAPTRRDAGIRERWICVQGRRTRAA